MWYLAYSTVLTTPKPHRSAPYSLHVYGYKLLVSECFAHLPRKIVCKFASRLLMLLRLRLAFALPVNICFDRLWVMHAEHDLAVARLALFRAARHVLHNGLVLLGLKPLHRM